MEPLVSVIIPVHNVAPYLREALDSVINQTYKNLEIIIIDDGSTDGSDKICDIYQQKDPRITVFHQKNRGLSAARNVGLDNMHGDIVSFLDPDDAFLPDMINTMVKNMIKTHSEIVVCGFYNYKTVKKMTESYTIDKSSMIDGVFSSATALNLLFEGKINVVVWNKLYIRQLFDKLRFKEGYVYEDRLLTPNIIEKAERIMTLSEPLICYRLRSDSITRTNSDKNLYDRLYAGKKEEDFITEHTPDIFSYNQKDKFLQSGLRRSIWYFLDFNYDCFRKCTVKRKIKRQYEVEIKRRAKSISKYSLKTKIAYLLFNIDPHFCYFVKHVYNYVKNLKNYRKYK